MIDLHGTDSIDDAVRRSRELSEHVDAHARAHAGDLLTAALATLVGLHVQQSLAEGADPGEAVARVAQIARDVATDDHDWLPSRRSVAPRTRTFVFRRDGYACVDCGEDDVFKLTVDHRVPVHFDGSNVADNLITRCRSCNASKGTEVR